MHPRFSILRQTHGRAAVDGPNVALGSFASLGAYRVATQQLFCPFVTSHITQKKTANPRVNWLNFGYEVGFEPTTFRLLV